MNPSTDKIPPPDERTVVAYLKALGLDPEDILAEGWDRTSYLRIQRTDDGKVAYFQGQVVTERVDWPANFDYNFFIAVTWRFRNS